MRYVLGSQLETRSSASAFSLAWCLRMTTQITSPYNPNAQPPEPTFISRQKWTKVAPSFPTYLCSSHNPQVSFLWLPDLLSWILLTRTRGDTTHNLSLLLHPLSMIPFHVHLASYSSPASWSAVYGTCTTAQMPYWSDGWMYIPYYWRKHTLYLRGSKPSEGCLLEA